MNELGYVALRFLLREVFCSQKQWRNCVVQGWVVRGAETLFFSCAILHFRFRKHLQLLGGYRVAAIYVGIFDSIICQAYMCTDFRGSGKGVTQYGVHMYVKWGGGSCGVEIPPRPSEPRHESSLCHLQPHLEFHRPLYSIQIFSKEQRRRNRNGKMALNPTISLYLHG